MYVALHICHISDICVSVSTSSRYWVLSKNYYLNYDIIDVQNEDEENGIEEPHSPLCENDFMEADLDEINVQTLTSENSG